MTAPTCLVWDLAGTPSPVASMAKLLVDKPAVCRVCAEPADHTAPAARALGANFTDQSLYLDPRSDRVCGACLWCCSGKPPATLRMWSIVAIPGAVLPDSNPKAFVQGQRGLYLGARGDTTGRLVAMVLAHPPEDDWLVSVAMSGQKHVLPYATVNHGRGRWSVRVETATVSATPTEWATVHQNARRLCRLGIPADDVRTGIPRYLKTGDDVRRWQAWDRHLTGYHCSPLLDLALWTLTKGNLT